MNNGRDKKQETNREWVKMTQLIISKEKIEKVMEKYARENYESKATFSEWVEYNEPKGMVFKFKEKKWNGLK